MRLQKCSFLFNVHRSNFKIVLNGTQFNELLFLFSVILGKSHYLLYCLVPAMYPRWLVTLDENQEPVSVSVRVGQVSVKKKEGAVSQGHSPEKCRSMEKWRTPSSEINLECRPFFRNCDISIFRVIFLVPWSHNYAKRYWLYIVTFHM